MTSWKHARFSDTPSLPPQEPTKHQRAVEHCQRTIQGFYTARSYGYGPGRLQRDITGVRMQGFKAALRHAMRSWRVLNPDRLQGSEVDLADVVADLGLQYALDDPDTLSLARFIPDGFVIDVPDKRIDCYEVEDHHRLSPDRLRAYFWFADALSEWFIVRLLIVDPRDLSVREFDLSHIDPFGGVEEVRDCR